MNNTLALQVRPGRTAEDIYTDTALLWGISLNWEEK